MYSIDSFEWTSLFMYIILFSFFYKLIKVSRVIAFMDNLNTQVHIYKYVYLLHCKYISFH